MIGSTAAVDAEARGMPVRWREKASAVAASSSVSPTQRIYIWRAIGPSETRPGAKSVQFALQPPPGKEDYQPGYSLSVKNEGDNLDAAMAQRYCYNDSFF